MAVKCTIHFPHQNTKNSIAKPYNVYIIGAILVFPQRHHGYCTNVYSHALYAFEYPRQTWKSAIIKEVTVTCKRDACVGLSGAIWHVYMNLYVCYLICNGQYR